MDRAPASPVCPHQVEEWRNGSQGKTGGTSTGPVVPESISPGPPTPSQTHPIISLKVAMHNFSHCSHRGHSTSANPLSKNSCSDHLCRKSNGIYTNATTMKTNLARLWATRSIFLKNCISGGAEPGGPVVKNPPANAGDTGSSPGPGRSHTPRSN